MTAVNYVFCGLLALSGLGHLFGTFKFVEKGTEIFAWSLAGSLAAFLLAAFNIVRIWHPDDIFVAGVCLLGSVSWIAIVAIFGRSIQNIKDPRVLIHMVAAVGLAVPSLLTTLQALN